ncbi:MAG: HAD-IB family phosphatase [Candidatus Hodarchaeaceae archaeon]|nr:HAD-IB family phosphatase [Candidatus Hodarchaeaceae archaeon]
MRYKLVAFDMDGTLVVEESCWSTLHRHFGTQEAARRNLEAYERGEIDYQEFMRRDISLWRPPPHISEIEQVLASFTLAPKVADIVKDIHERGYSTAIITGGLDILARRVAEELRIGHVFANGLAVDERGHLSGEGIFRVEPSLKDEVLSRLVERLGMTLDECVAVGDSKYDVRFLKRAGLGVAIGGSSELARVADVVIRDFEHFPQLLDYL